MRIKPTGPAGTAPTLLVFTLGAAADARRHPLLPEASRGTELELRQACLETVLRAGREAGCRIAISSPSLPPGSGEVSWIPQRGATFGERLEAALAAAFRESAGPVVLVGSDVPGLDAEAIRGALAALEDDPDRVALGPSPDGGLYLLAARRPLGPVLGAVSWCGRQTLRTLRSALARAGRPVALLPSLRDLDRPADLEKWLAARTPVPSFGFRIETLRRLLARRRTPPPSRSAGPADPPKTLLLPPRAPPLSAC